MPQPWTDAGAAELAVCRALLRDGSRSFEAAARLLPRRVRHPAVALYAFCRVADDAIDGGGPGELAALRERLARVYEERPLPLPVDRAFASIVRRHALPRILPEALLEGFAWDAEGRRYADLSALRGYAVRVAIPFKSLRFTAQDMQTWGIALWRSIPANSEESFWPYVTNRVTGLVQQFAEGDGVDGVKPGRNLRLIPYFAFGDATALNTPDGLPPYFQTTHDVRVGLDAKLVLHGTLTLDATINPDFSQIESDDPQVTVNQRFAVFFPEKRPFFLENAAYFQTPENLFFSRTIVDPQAGGRLTGRLGAWSLGLLAVVDRGPGKVLEVTDPNYGDRATIGVLRVQRDLFEQSSIGIFASSRD